MLVRHTHTVCIPVLLLASLFTTSTVLARADDPLPSWNDVASKRAIIQFVQRVTTEGSSDFVPVAKRVATFDNDGTLWSEQPLYFQAFFAFDRVKKLAAEHPEWTTTEPFASVLKNDYAAALKGGKESLLKLVMASHTGMTSDEFEAIVSDWIKTARHPKTGRLFTEMVYQPMLELMDYLRANQFRVFIVSGGGIDFIRPWAERVYGISSDDVVGSSVKYEFEVRDGQAVVVRLPELGFIDDEEAKPVGIQKHIGVRPLFAAGNSDGDFQMLQWTMAGDGPRFALVIHHTDATREWAYDRESSIGRLDRGLDEGLELGFVLVDMKEDWDRIYPPLSSPGSDTDALAGSWAARRIGDRPAVQDSSVTLDITADGDVSGSTGVNRFSGSAEIDGQRIKFSPLATTRRGGPPALMQQESALTKSLSQTSQFTIRDDGTLVLMDDQGTELIKYSKR